LSLAFLLQTWLDEHIGRSGEDGAKMLTVMVLAVFLIPISFMVTDEIRVELRELLDRWRAHHI
jgi:hypothetical protein